MIPKSPSVSIVVFSMDYETSQLTQVTINVWNKLSTDCVHATSVNVFKNRIDKYLVKAGYT